MILGKYQWILDDSNQGKNKHQARNQKPQEMINDILENRGLVTQDEKDEFLRPSFENMHDPMDLLDMDKAVARIKQAKKNNEKITIYGDYDVDGITSTSILYMFLLENGYHIDYYIPDRVEEGYGFNKEALQALKNTGTKLIISVDTGISAIEEVEFAKAMGLDIIITDHHTCPKELPEAWAVINPKRIDSTYPFDALAGVGVAFKLIHALAIHWNQVSSIWKYIDLVAIGTVADVVPLVDENRIIVSKAFNTIPKTWNVGLEALLEVSGVKGKKITSGTIGFQIGPRLNVAGRLGDAKKGVKLFTTQDKALAMVIAKELDEENKKRQQIEQDILDLAIKKIEQTKEIKENNIIVVAGQGWHKGVVGIVASRITEQYYKPSIVISIDQDGMATGSARSISGFSMFDALSDAKAYLTQFGGHSMAAGLSLKEEMIPDFTRHINSYSKKIIDKEMLKPKLTIDAHINEENITLDMADALEQLEPYGLGNPTPVFSYEGEIYSADGIGANKNHLRLKMYTRQELINGIGFNMGYQSRVLSQGESVLVAGNLQKNEWQGKVSPQLVIKDIKSPEQENRMGQYYLSLYSKLPEPTLDQFKVFTNHRKSCNMNNKLDDLEKEYTRQLEMMIPTREDIVEIYRYLRTQSFSCIGEVYLHAMKRNIKNITEYKIMQGLYIFKELGLLTYTYYEDEGLIKFRIIPEVKNDLTNSKRFQYLNQLK